MAMSEMSYDQTSYERTISTLQNQIEKGIADRANAGCWSQSAALHAITSLMRAGGRVSQRSQLVVKSRAFKFSINVSIVASVLEIGASVQFSGPSVCVLWNILEHTFTAIFLLEMVIKLLAWRRTYFQSALDFCDFFVAWIGVLDKWLIPIITRSPTSYPILTMFKLLRLLKVVRVLTIYRTFCIVADGIASSMTAMLWVGVLLTLAIYSFSVFCVMTFRSHSEVHMYFNDIPTSMLSLFNLALLDEWSIIIRPISVSHPLTVPLFIIFVASTTFGLVNVIIGIIIESTNRAEARCRAHDLHAKREFMMSKVSQLSDMFHQLDVDSDGIFSQKDFTGVVNHPKFQVLLQDLELPKGFTIEDLYTLLNTKCDKRLTEQDFVDGMYRMIHNNVSQHQFMMQLSLMQVKAIVQQSQEETRAQIQVGMNRVLDEIGFLRAKIESSTPKADNLKKTKVLSAKSTPSHSRSQIENMFSFKEDTETLDGIPGIEASLETYVEMSRLRQPKSPESPDSEHCVGTRNRGDTPAPQVIDVPPQTRTMTRWPSAQHWAAGPSHEHIPLYTNPCTAIALRPSDSEETCSSCSDCKFLL